MTSQAVIFNAAQSHLAAFEEEFYEPAMRWLLEVEKQARQIFSLQNDGGSVKGMLLSPEILLPRTPRAKRKYVEEEEEHGLNKESTFHDNANVSGNKRLKIDDLSTIIDVSTEIDNTSSSTSSNKSRALRPRKNAKNGKPTQLAKQGKRGPVKMNIEVKSIVTSQKFVPPKEIERAVLISTPQQKSKKPICPVILNSPTVTNQDAACKLNEEVKINTPEILTKDTLTDIDSTHTQVTNPSLQLHVPASNSVISKVNVLASTPTKTPPHQHSTPTHQKQPSTLIATPIETVHQNINDSINRDSPLPDTQECVGADDILRKNVNIDKLIQVRLDDIEPPLVEDTMEETQPMDEGVEGPPVKTVEASGPNKDLRAAQQDPNMELECKGNEELSSDPEMDEAVRTVESVPADEECSSESADEEAAAIVVAAEEKVRLVEDANRRNTYKVMVDKINDGETVKTANTEKGMLADKDGKKPAKIMKVAPVCSKPANVVTNIKSFLKNPVAPREEPPRKTGNVVMNVKSFVKHPSLTKKDVVYVKPGSNLVNVKSFVNKPSPKRDQPDTVAKKAAELEKKELIRQNALKDTKAGLQKKVDEKKKLREEREKNLAEQQRKRHEENEKRRLQLELKEAQIAKNQDEIRKARELEEKQRREARDVKKAELDARRQREEEECRKKKAEMLRDEKRKQEVIQKKMELDEQKRMKKRVEKEMAEKEKQRLLEELRVVEEEKKKREFEEKERHRWEVKKKKDDERDKERVERQIREEKNRQAEKEINDAKKHEEERQRQREEEKIRAKEKLREEIKAKTASQHLGHQKTIVDVQNLLKSSSGLKEQSKNPSSKMASEAAPRSSPRLNKGKEETTTRRWKPPVVPLVTRDSVFIDYGIEDLGSDDSTDDESQPAKRIPSWAVGGRLKKQLTRQFYTDIDPDDIFVNCMEPLRLEKIFKKNKTRYFTRSSSAHWSSPPIKGYNY